MIKRSFAEIDATRHISDNQEALHSLKESIQSLQEEDCPICIQDINQYYSACATVTNFHKKMQVSIKAMGQSSSKLFETKKTNLLTLGSCTARLR